MGKIVLGGSLLYFARAGATIDGITVSETSKPDGSPEANWTRLANETEIAVKNDSKYYTQRRLVNGISVPGAKVLSEWNCTATIKFDEICKEFVESVLCMPSGTLGTAARPGDADGIIRGWFKLQDYAGDGSVITVCDLWGAASVKELSRALGKETMFTLDVDVLWSDSNSAVITNL